MENMSRVLMFVVTKVIGVEVVDYLCWSTSDRDLPSQRALHSPSTSGLPLAESFPTRIENSWIFVARLRLILSYNARRSEIELLSDGVPIGKTAAIAAASSIACAAP
jgi:hypothetical protein